MCACPYPTLPLRIDSSAPHSARVWIVGRVAAAEAAPRVAAPAAPSASDVPGSTTDTCTVGATALLLSTRTWVWSPSTT